jgi:hypothetical protein
MVVTMETGFYPHLMPKGTLFFIILQQIQLETAIKNRWAQLPVAVQVSGKYPENLFPKKTRTGCYCWVQT